MHNAIKPGKMRALNKFVNRKGWVLSLSTVPQLNGKSCSSKTFSSFLRNGIWAEASNTATLLENNLLTPNRDLSQFQHFFGKGVLVQKFIEMCIITYQDQYHWAKLANHGTMVIWVGFAEGHPVGTYHA